MSIDTAAYINFLNALFLDEHPGLTCDDCGLTYSPPVYRTIVNCRANGHDLPQFAELCSGNICCKCAGVMLGPDDPNDPRFIALQRAIARKYK